MFKEKLKLKEKQTKLMDLYLDGGIEKEILNRKNEDINKRKYEIEELEEIRLAYAISIHKSQGSEFKLVIVSLISMLGKLSFDSSYHLRNVLIELNREFDSEMSLDLARRKSKVVITAVSLALQYN